MYYPRFFVEKFLLWAPWKSGVDTSKTPYQYRPQTFYDVTNSADMPSSSYTIDLDATPGDGQRTATLVIPQTAWDTTYSDVSYNEGHNVEKLALVLLYII